MSPAPLGGYVLAGGRSSRMGRDKACLPWEGGTLIQYVAHQVRLAAGSVFQIGGKPVHGLQSAPDLYPGFGPVGGIASALLHSDAENNLVVACDMPFVTAALLRRLFEPAAGDVAVASAAGRLHPVCAVWRRSALGVLLTAIATDERRLFGVIEKLDVVAVPADEAAVRNVNTPAEWLKAAAQET